MSVVCVHKFGNCIEFACDSQATIGDMKVDTTKWAYKDGWFMGFAGSLSMMNFLVNWVNWSDINEVNYHQKISEVMKKIKKEFFEEDDFSISFLATNGEMVIYGDSNYLINEVHTFDAIGSGSPTAMPSLSHGHTVRACEDACRFSAMCQLPIHHFIFTKDSKMSYNLLFSEEFEEEKIGVDGRMDEFYKIVNAKSGQRRG